jgi:hypothetical protein
MTKRTLVIRRQGLHDSEEVSFELPSDRVPTRAELANAKDVLDSGTPAVRLASLHARALAFPDDEVVKLELQWLDDNLHDPASRLALANLLALERGIALLETGAHVPAVDAHHAMQKGRRAGGQAKKKLTPEQEQEIRDAYADLVARGKKHGAIKTIASLIPVSTKTVARVLAKK